MTTLANKKYFIISVVAHLSILLMIILGFDFAAPLVVVENTNKSDVISAVILGDIQKSKIVTPPQQQVVQSEPLPKPKVVQVKKDVIALKPAIKKKPNDIFGKDLLADFDKLKKKSEKQNKLKQAQLKAQLKAQLEKTMRQQLLNEDIKMSGTQSRQAQGIVNKYQALIQQAISEHWIIPPQANKKSYSVLLIRLAPSGVVLDVQVTKSSGDPALDSSARAAVFKASPLPVPGDPVAFESFRQFNLKARPENIMDETSRI